MGEAQTQGGVDLVLALFRLAVCDYAGLAYGHDDPGRPRAVRPRHRAHAELFLRGWWANALAEWLGLSGEQIWREAQELRLAEERRPLRYPLPATAPDPVPLRVAASRARTVEAASNAA
ncbi:MAG TPA: hypothetical protein VIN56_04795 [Candidatus Dormibacteraeota bacterium]|jgi:hypothetical protein